LICREAVHLIHGASGLCVSVVIGFLWLQMLVRIINLHVG